MRAIWRQRNGCAPHTFHRCRLPMFCARKIRTAFVQLDHENSNSIHRLYSSFAWTVCLLLLLIACFVFPPMAKAVVPPPDGGYPNFTTAEGQKALFSLTTGSANTAVGWFSLFSNAAGSFNTATGTGRSFSTPQTQIRHLARLGFYSTPPGSTTPPSELPPF